MSELEFKVSPPRLYGDGTSVKCRPKDWNGGGGGGGGIDHVIPGFIV